CFAMIAVLTVAVSVCSRAQNQSYPNDRGQMPKSRAEQEADAKVSFSAETIIAMLRREPGLFLQIKKMLVRTAYEHGRVLDSSDLTDDEVFRLLRENENIRILATHEIEDRSYIRAKPTQAEIARENALAAQYAVTSGTQVPTLPQSQSQTLPTRSSALSQDQLSQEQQYWSMHDRLTAPYGVPSQIPKNQVPQTNPPIPQEETPAPNLAPVNPQRQLNQASSQQPQDFANTDQDTSTGMSRISSDQLSSLINSNPQAALALASNSGARIPAGGSSSASSEMAGPSLPDFSAASDTTRPSSLGKTSFSNVSTSDQSRYPARYPTELNLDRPQIRQKPNP